MGYRFRSRQFPSTQVSAWFPKATRTRLANFDFLPSDIPSLQLWLDAADLTTITESSGSVTQWNDKSGNGYNVTQGTAANRPTTGTRTLNGRNVIDFDGTNDNLSRLTSMGLWQNITGGTIYVVSVYDVSPASVVLMFFLRRGAASMAGHFPGNTANKYVAGGRNAATDSIQVANSTNNITTATGIIQSSVYDIANTDLFVYINGVLEGSNTSYQTSTSTTNVASDQLEVGAASNGGNPFNGTMGEILLYHSAHTTEERQAVESYLKTKWGI